MFRILFSSQTHSRVVEHFRAQNVLNSTKQPETNNLLTDNTVSIFIQRVNKDKLHNIHHLTKIKQHQSLKNKLINRKCINFGETY